MFSNTVSIVGSETLVATCFISAVQDHEKLCYEIVGGQRLLNCLHINSLSTLDHCDRLLVTVSP